MSFSFTYPAIVDDYQTFPPAPLLPKKKISVASIFFSNFYKTMYLGDAHLDILLMMKLHFTSATDK